MKLPILTLILLATANTSLAQDGVEKYDYLVQILFSIAEERIPRYLIDVIYKRPVEKGISTQAVLDLYQINSITLASVQNILQQLNVSQSDIFSLDTFNHTLTKCNLTFPTFYSTLITRLNLAGVPLRDGLETLQIDVNQFSAGIAYGEPDPWQEFIKGNFSQGNLEAACIKAGISLENLWAGFRDIIVNELAKFRITNFVQMLLTHKIRQEEALSIWNAVPVSNEHVSSVKVFDDVIGNLSAQLHNQPILGVVVDSHEVAIHRTVHEIIKDDRDILDIAARTYFTSTTFNLDTINDTTYKNIVLFKQSDLSVRENLTTISVAYQSSDLQANCSYFTMNNEVIVQMSIEKAVFNNETYIPMNYVDSIVLGSALVCNNSVYGLARGINEEHHIVFDAFSKYVAPTPSSAVSSHVSMHLLASVFLFYVMKFFEF